MQAGDSTTVVALHHSVNVRGENERPITATWKTCLLSCDELQNHFFVVTVLMY